MTKTARNSKELSVIEFSGLADIANIISNRRRFGEVAKSYDCRGTQYIIPSKFPLLDISLSSRYS